MSAAKSDLTEKQYHEFNILKKILTEMDVESLSSLSAQNKQNIETFKNNLLISGYTDLLGVSETSPVTLEYIERKAVISHVEAKLLNVYAKDLIKLQSLKKLTELNEQINQMHIKRQNMIQEFKEVADRKMKLLEEVMAMKTKASKLKLVENMVQESQLNALKILYLEKALTTKIMTTTAQFSEALQEVEKNLIKILESKSS